ncbi:hypothetical protein BVX97_03375 [bacterium E08(2017)]|nr:hypothetical protein BVX97_03375 [bacterium E08(2017)]
MLSLKTIVKVYLVVLTIASAQFCSASDDPIKKLQGVYDKSLEEINQEDFAQKLQLNQTYAKSLKTLCDKKQKAGDLDGWRIAKEEFDKFEADNKVTDDALSSNSEIKALQQSYIHSRGTAKKAKNAKIVELTDKYCKHLSSKVQGCTKAGKMQEAIAYDAELKRVKDSSTYKDAQLVIAASLKPTAPKVEEPDAVAAIAPPEKKEISAPTGFNIYKKSDRRTGMAKGITYKPLGLRPTGRTGLRAPILVKAEMSKDSTRSSHNVYYSDVKTSNTRAIRLRLRAARLEETHNDLLVLIQYFSRTVSRSDVNPVDNHAIPIAYLDKQELVVECPPLSFSKNRSDYYGKSGSEFYGILVSVFGPDKKTLLYQGMSASGLNDFSSSASNASESHLSKQRVGALRSAYEQAREQNAAGGMLYEEYYKHQQAYYQARDEHNAKYPNDRYQ